MPYNPLRPVICFDERPCFLIGDVVECLPMKEGSPKKENYAYSKHGSCCVLAAIEPKTGKRLAHVRCHRGCKEFAIFMRNLASLYTNVDKICVVLDNLNTHTYAAFYQTFPAEEAAELADRFEFIYTPKSASWLNMIEIEFSAMSKQCLNRRISSINELASEVMTYFKERDRLGIKINWQFSAESARQKFNRFYCKMNSDNIKYRII